MPVIDNSWCYTLVTLVFSAVIGPRGLEKWRILHSTQSQRTGPVLDTSLVKTTLRDHNISVRFSLTVSWRVLSSLSPSSEISNSHLISNIHYNTGSCLWLFSSVSLPPYPRMNVAEHGQRVRQTNLVVKFILCLIVPAYHTVQAELGNIDNIDNDDAYWPPSEGPSSGLSTLRYWLVLSLIFLTELFLDQVSLSLSPSCSVLKVLFLAWCVLPVDNNGTLLIWENVRFYFSVWWVLDHWLCSQVLQPVFKISFDLVNDVMRNKILEELLDTCQDMVKRFINCIIKLSRPKPEPSYLEQVFIYLRNLFKSLFWKEAKTRRLFSDLVKNLSRCELNWKMW